MTIKDGSVVSMEYTLTGDDGEVIDSNVDQEPFQYIHGEGQIVPGLEKALAGKAEGDTMKVEVNASEGYGEVDTEAFIDVPQEKIPEDARHVGAYLQTIGEDGQTLMAHVSEVKEDVVVLNYNHPLAGQTLNFEVKVLKVEEQE